MMKNKLSFYFVFIAFFTSIAIFVFIVQRSYSNLIGPSQKIDTENLLKKINPTLDTSVIDEIKNRPESLDEGEVNFIMGEVETTPSATSTKTNESSSSSTINQNPEE